MAVPWVPNAWPSEARPPGAALPRAESTLAGFSRHVRLSSHGHHLGFLLELGLPKAFVLSQSPLRHMSHLIGAKAACMARRDCRVRPAVRTPLVESELQNFKAKSDLENRQEWSDDSVHEKSEVQQGSAVCPQCGFVSLGETENCLSSPWHPARGSSTAEGRVLMSASPRAHRPAAPARKGGLVLPADASASVEGQGTAPHPPGLRKARRPVGEVWKSSPWGGR